MGAGRAAAARLSTRSRQAWRGSTRRPTDIVFRFVHLGRITCDHNRTFLAHGRDRVWKNCNFADGNGSGTAATPCLTILLTTTRPSRWRGRDSSPCRRPRPCGSDPQFAAPELTSTVRTASPLPVSSSVPWRTRMGYRAANRRATARFPPHPGRRGFPRGATQFTYTVSPMAWGALPRAQRPVVAFTLARLAQTIGTGGVRSRGHPLGSLRPAAGCLHRMTRGRATRWVRAAPGCSTAPRNSAASKHRASQVDNIFRPRPRISSRRLCSVFTHGEPTDAPTGRSSGAQRDASV